MRKTILILALAALPAAAWAAEALPPWAFLMPDAGHKPLADNGAKHHLPGSAKAYTMAEVNDLDNPPDWYPNQHPPMPHVVAHGAPGMVFACSSCHLTSGMGHPESARLAGDSVDYIVRALGEFKSGNRISHSIMNDVVKNLTDADAKAAAEYFSKLKTEPGWVKVVESKTVPKSYVEEHVMRIPEAGGGVEPLGERIIELPKNLQYALLRDPNSGTVAYVPPGSEAAGKTLVTTGGGGTTIACAICHGPKLTGLGDVPGIAGRSPVYIFRQLYLFKNGDRHGPNAALMKTVVAKMQQKDMIDAAAYVATLKQQ